MKKYEPFKDVFKECDRKFTQSISRTHIFITQSLFNERRSVADYSFQTLLITFWGKNLWIQVLANFPLDSFFTYDETVTIPSRPIFELYISNMLIVKKEEALIKLPKLQLNHAHNNKLKGRIF